MIGRFGFAASRAAFAAKQGASNASRAAPLVRNSAKAGAALTAAGLAYSSTAEKTVECESNGVAIAGAGIAGVVVGTVIGMLYEYQTTQKARPSLPLAGAKRECV